MRCMYESQPLACKSLEMKPQNLCVHQTNKRTPKRGRSKKKDIKGMFSMFALQVHISGGEFESELTCGGSVCAPEEGGESEPDELELRRRGKVFK
jgi:hypothetical protein